jgi:prevent-host-death family protein
MASVPDIVPITDLRQDASGVIKRAADTQQPVFITQRGRAAAVVVSVKAYQRSQHELEILRLLARGEAEIDAGSGHALIDVLAEADELLRRP